MTNRELLKLAAKAAGIEIMPCTCGDEKWPFKHNEAISGRRGHWNPLEDDGDSMRLAVKLRIGMVFHHGLVIVGNGGKAHADEMIEDYKYAIVRAAAALAGESQG